MSSPPKPQRRRPRKPESAEQQQARREHDNAGGAPDLTEEQRERKARLLSNFRAFAQMWQGAWYYEQPHDEMCDELEQCLPIVGTQAQKKQIYLAPRYSYKTSLLIAFMVYAILRYREDGVDIAIDYVRATRELAFEVLYELKQGLEKAEALHPELYELWGDLSLQANTWAQDKINLGSRRDASVSTAGLDYGASGKHPDIVILDDIVNEKNFESIKAIKSAKNKLQAYYPILPPWGTIIDCGTRFSFRDVHGWLLTQNAERAESEARLLSEAEAKEALGALDEGVSLRRKAAIAKPVWREYIRSAWYDDGRLFFPARLSEDFLEAQREEIEPGMFASWYLNRPIAEGQQLFRPEYLRYFQGHLSNEPFPVLEITKDVAGRDVTVEAKPVRVTMTIDPTTTANGRSDYTGVTVVAADANGNWYVLLAQNYLLVPSLMGEQAVKIIRRFAPSVCRIESAQADAQMVSRIQRAISEENLKTSVGSYSPLRDETARSGRQQKARRIRALEPKFRNGQMWLQRGECAPLVRQYNEWPDVEHDDVMDALAMQYDLATRCRYRSLQDVEFQEMAAEDSEKASDILREIVFRARDQHGEEIEFRLPTMAATVTRGGRGAVGFGAQRYGRGE